MRNMKRAWWSIRHQPKRTLLLLMLLTVVTTLLLTGIGITSAVDSASRIARQQMDAQLTLQPDMMKLIQGGDQNAWPAIDTMLKQKIEKMKHVQAVKTDTKAYLYSKYKHATTPQQDQTFGDLDSQSFTVGNEVKGNVANQYLYGMNEKNDILAFKNGTSFLSEGVMPYESKVENPLLISKALAEKNGLKLDDKVKFEAGPNSDVATEFTVCGLFDVAEKKTTSTSDGFPEMPMNTQPNLFYSSVKATEKAALLGDSAAKINYEKMTVKVDSIDNLPAVAASIKKKLTGNTEYLQFTSEEAQYEKMVKAINNVAAIARMLIIVVGTAGTLILTLLLLLSFRERRYEIGVLLAMGETKGRLMSQILGEVLVLSLVAFAIATVSSQFIGDQLSQRMVDDQVATMNAEKTETPQQDMVIMSDANQETPKETKPIDTIKVNIYQPQTLLFGAAISLIVAIIGTLVPLLLLFRRDPKQILVAF